MLICCVESSLCFEMTFQKELRLNLMKTMKGMMLQKKKQMTMTTHFLIHGISYHQVLLRVVDLIIRDRLIQMMKIFMPSVVRMVVMIP